MNYVESDTFTNTNLASLIDKPSAENIITKLHPKFKTIVEGNLWIVDNFLTDEECDRMIQKIEELGFHEALLNVGNGKQILAKDVRDCKRCMIDDFDAADIIKKRLENILPLANQGGVMSSVNQRFRFLKYEKGNQFRTHMDGRFSREINGYEETSVFTIHFYLNDGSAGGETIFYDEHFFKSGDGEFKCEPKKGRVAIFRQYGFYHCGAKVYDGIKYTVRTEMMYRKLLPNEEITKTPPSCGFCGSALFYKRCSKSQELVPSCKCPHEYSDTFQKFPCISCGRGTTYEDIAEGSSKCGCF